MIGSATRYQRALKTALTGAADAPLVLLCNFEVETFWARNHVGLPGPAFSASSRVVARMEELGALLAGPDDYLLLSEPLDPGFRAYAEARGFALPTVLVPDRAEPSASTTERAAASPGLLHRLARIAEAGGRLLPMGVSTGEQALAEACGIKLAVPNADVFERVNSKIYGRRLTEAAGLRPVPGHCCTSASELVEILGRYRPHSGHRVVVKDAFGVSGKGLVVLDSTAKADRLLKLVRRRAERSGDDRLEVVVEEWLPKRFDLNYQFTVTRDGEITLDFVKQALTEHGVHKGHIMPAELAPEHFEQLHEAAEVIGKRLHADGFAGVAGVDAILGADGTLYPVLEINARLNMSTYQGAVTELRHRAGEMALAKHFTLRLAAAATFADVERALEPLPGLVITCFGTVNANAADPQPFEGRLYVMLFAPDRDRLAELDAAAAGALARLPNCLEVR